MEEVHRSKRKGKTEGPSRGRHRGTRRNRIIGALGCLVLVAAVLGGIAGGWLPYRSLRIPAPRHVRDPGASPVPGTSPGPGTSARPGPSPDPGTPAPPGHPGGAADGPFRAVAAERDAGLRPGEDFHGASIGLVIDDFGYQRALDASFLTLPFPFTPAILPGRPASAWDTEIASLKGRPYLLHLPMQPRSPARPEHDAIRVDMSDEAIRRAVEDALHLVPGSAGVNNHEGSLVTADPRAMGSVMDVLRLHGLVYLDSMTTGESVGYEVARAFGVTSWKNDLFLDNSPDQALIEKQVVRLARMARKHGFAIGIAHSRPATYRALRATVPLLQNRGARFVDLREWPGSTLARREGAPDAVR